MSSSTSSGSIWVVDPLEDERVEWHFWVSSKEGVACVIAGDQTVKQIVERMRAATGRGTYVITNVRAKVNCPLCLEWIHA